MKVLIPLSTLAGLLLVAVCVGAPIEFDFGARYGLAGDGSDSAIDPHALRTIIKGSEEGKHDSIYLLGLMKFYGHGVGQDVKAAVRYFQLAANKGNIDAKFTLAVLAYNGEELQQDNKLAAQYLAEAVKYDHEDALWLLGTLYNEGRGVDEDPSYAFQLFQKAFTKGSARGAFQLGRMYEYGRAINGSNYTEAARLYAYAAAAHLPEAQYYLGLMIAYGRGFQQDYAKAATFFHQAAAPIDYQRQRHRSAGAMLMLAKMHFHGQGVPINYDMALYWFDQAKQEAIDKEEMIYEEAKTGYDELKVLLRQAQRNRQLIDDYKMSDEL